MKEYKQPQSKYGYIQTEPNDDEINQYLTQSSQEIVGANENDHSVGHQAHQFQQIIDSSVDQQAQSSSAGQNVSILTRGNLNLSKTYQGNTSQANVNNSYQVQTKKGFVAQQKGGDMQIKDSDDTPSRLKELTYYAFDESSPSLLYSPGDCTQSPTLEDRITRKTQKLKGQISEFFHQKERATNNNSQKIKQQLDKITNAQALAKSTCFNYPPGENPDDRPIRPSPTREFFGNPKEHGGTALRTDRRAYRPNAQHADSQERFHNSSAEQNSTVMVGKRTIDLNAAEEDIMVQQNKGKLNKKNSQRCSPRKIITKPQQPDTSGLSTYQKLLQAKGLGSPAKVSKTSHPKALKVDALSSSKRLSSKGATTPQNHLASMMQGPSTPQHKVEIGRFGSKMKQYKVLPPQKATLNLFDNRKGSNNDGVSSSCLTVSERSKKSRQSKSPTAIRGEKSAQTVTANIIKASQRKQLSIGKVGYPFEDDLSMDQSCRIDTSQIVVNKIKSTKNKQFIKKGGLVKNVSSGFQSSLGQISTPTAKLSHQASTGVQSAKGRKIMTQSTLGHAQTTSKKMQSRNDIHYQTAGKNIGNDGKNPKAQKPIKGQKTNSNNIGILHHSKSNSLSINQKISLKTIPSSNPVQTTLNSSNNPSASKMMRHTTNNSGLKAQRQMRPLATSGVPSKVGQISIYTPATVSSKPQFDALQMSEQVVNHSAQKMKTTKNTQSQKNKFANAIRMIEEVQYDPNHVNLDERGLNSFKNAKIYNKMKSTSSYNNNPHSLQEIKEMKSFSPNPQRDGPNKKNNKLTSRDNAYDEHRRKTIDSSQIGQHLVGKQQRPNKFDANQVPMNQQMPFNQAQRLQNSTNRNGSSTHRQLTGNNQDPPIEQQYNSRHKPQSHSRSGRSPIEFQNVGMNQQYTPLQNIQPQQQPALTQRFSMPLSNYDNLDSSDYKNSILKKNSSIKSPIFNQKQNQHYLSNSNPTANPKKNREKPTVVPIPQLTSANIKQDANFGSLQRAVGIVSQQSAQKKGGQRRDRSQTHHLPQTNNEINNSSQSEHRLDKKMTNRVRFQNTDRNENNYSVRSNGEAPTGKELSNLREMRDQRKVSKSILRSQGYKSNMSEREEAENQNYDYVDGNQNNYSNKMTEMQNQLNQLEQLSAENRSKNGSQRRMRSSSFQRQNMSGAGFGATSSHSASQKDLQQEQNRKNMQVPGKQLAAQLGGLPPAYHQRLHSMQIETPSQNHSRHQSKNQNSQSSANQDAQQLLNNFNSTTKKVMIDLSNPQVQKKQQQDRQEVGRKYSMNTYDADQNQHGQAVYDNSGQNKNRQIQINLASVASYNQLQEQQEQQSWGENVTEPAMMRVGTTPRGINANNQPVFNQKTRDKSKSQKRALVQKHDTMTEKLSRELLRQQQYQTNANGIPQSDQSFSKSSLQHAQQNQIPSGLQSPQNIQNDNSMYQQRIRSKNQTQYVQGKTQQLLMTQNNVAEITPKNGMNSERYINQNHYV